MTDPLGQSQVIPYLIGLGRRGFEFHVLSFEKPGRMRSAANRVQAELDTHGIRWVPLRYTRRPPVLSTLYDIARMWRSARSLSGTTRFDLIHCRGYVPALVGRRLARRLKVPFVFDMRGFWPEEKVDAGAWKLRNPVYRSIYAFFKAEERAALQSAAGVVVLTDKARRVLETRPERPGSLPPAVIPCAVDFSRFTVPGDESRARVRADLGIGHGDLVAAYVGSLGTWYLLPEMLDFFQVLSERTSGRTHFLVVTQDSPAIVHAAAAARRIPERALSIVSAFQAEVPGYLAAADFGISFIRPSWSKMASSPTKIGEYLAVGLPVVANRGIGDIDALFRSGGTGIPVEGFSRDAYIAAIDQLSGVLPGNPAQRRASAAGIYDLEGAVAKYATLYRCVLEGMQ